MRKASAEPVTDTFSISALTFLSLTARLVISGRPSYISLLSISSEGLSEREKDEDLIVSPVIGISGRPTMNPLDALLPVA